MDARFSTPMLAAGAVLIVSLTGCDKPHEAVVKPQDVAAPTRPDPAAPAPGSQAAEAIGADSSTDTAVIGPEKPQP